MGAPQSSEGFHVLRPEEEAVTGLPEQAEVLAGVEIALTRYAHALRELAK